MYPGPYLGFFVCGGKLVFRKISDQYSYKKQPSKIRHYVRKKTFSFPGGDNCPLRPPAMYGPGIEICPRKSSYESQSCKVFRPFSERLLWMNTEEQNNTHRSYFLKNLFENPNVSVLKWNSLILALCARLRLLKLN